MSERIADYRDHEAIEEFCPVCGAPVERTEERGTWDVYGPADLRLAAKYGITTEGPVTTLWWSWRCSQDSRHYWGPILFADPNEKKGPA